MASEPGESVDPSDQTPRATDARSAQDDEPPPAALLELRGITKRYGTLVANDDVSLTLRPGEIHAVVGENGAGKSTLTKIAYGVQVPDSGQILVRGQPRTIRSPRQAKALRIGMVYQHFALVPDQTVLQNIVLSDSNASMWAPNLRRAERRIKAICEDFGLELDLDARVDSLPVGQQQRVEIVKLLHQGAEVLIFDEPTAVLTSAEWDRLADVMRDLARRGRAVIFITHKMQELLDVADRCTVLRAGRVVACLERSEMQRDELARLIVGAEPRPRTPRARQAAGRPVLEVEDLTLGNSRGHRVLDSLDLQVRSGEIVGIAGVSGNGQSELLEALAGTRHPLSGTILLNGEVVTTWSPARLAEAGVAVVPEDRHRVGLALEMSVVDNLVMEEIGQRRLSRRGVLDRPEILRFSRELIDEYGISTTNDQGPVARLSGGNQQRVVIARCLRRSPALLVAAEPTRGLDLRNIAVVHERLASFVRHGGAVLLVSSELDEILALSDRVVVFAGGKATAPVDVATIGMTEIGLAMAGAAPW